MHLLRKKNKKIWNMYVMIVIFYYLFNINKVEQNNTLFYYLIDLCTKFRCISINMK